MIMEEYCGYKEQCILACACKNQNFLNPLVIASNITQADSAHVDHCSDHVCILVYSIFQTSRGGGHQAHDVILESIEQWWLKTDQDVFITRILLNPFHKARPFCATLSQL